MRNARNSCTRATLANSRSQTLARKISLAPLTRVQISLSCNSHTLATLTRSQLSHARNSHTLATLTRSQLSPARNSHPLATRATHFTLSSPRALLLPVSRSLSLCLSLSVSLSLSLSLCLSLSVSLSLSLSLCLSLSVSLSLSLLSLSLLSLSLLSLSLLSLSLLSLSLLSLSVLSLTLQLSSLSDNSGGVMCLPRLRFIPLSHRGRWRSRCFGVGISVRRASRGTAESILLRRHRHLCCIEAHLLLRPICTTDA